MEPMAVTIVDEIRNANERFEQQFGRGDAEAIAGFYTPDGMLLPTGHEPVRGQAAIAAFWQQAMQDGLARVELHLTEVEQASANTVIELGSYRLCGEGGTVLDFGKYMGVWKQQEGHWRIQRDIWNSNQPQA